MSDRVFGAVFLLVALAFIASATQIQATFFSDPLGPKGFPIIAGVAVGASSLYMVLRPDAEPDWPDLRRLGEIVLVGAVLIAYVFVLVPLGHVLATTVAAAILSWRLGARPVNAAVVGAGVALGTYGVFRLALGLTLARGPWGF